MTSKLIYKRVIYIVKNGSLIVVFLSPLAEEDMSRGPRGATALPAALPGNDMSSSSEPGVSWSHMQNRGAGAHYKAPYIT